MTLMAKKKNPHPAPDAPTGQGVGCRKTSPPNTTLELLKDKLLLEFPIEQIGVSLSDGLSRQGAVTKTF